MARSPPVYHTVAGLRTTQMSINGDTVVDHQQGQRRVARAAVGRGGAVGFGRRLRDFPRLAAEAQVRASALAGLLDAYELRSKTARSCAASS